MRANGAGSSTPERDAGGLALSANTTDGTVAADRSGAAPEFFGKPFGNIYDLAFRRCGPGIDKARVLMVGDSLHTDVLGAQTAGIASALVTSHGFFAGGAVERWMDRSGIRPDFLLDHP